MQQIVNILAECKLAVIAWAITSAAASYTALWKRDAYDTAAAMADVATATTTTLPTTIFHAEIICLLATFACNICTINLVNQVQAYTTKMILDDIASARFTARTPAAIDSMFAAGNALSSDLARFIYMIMPIPFIILRLLLVGWSGQFALIIVALLLPLAVLLANINGQFASATATKLHTANKYRQGLKARLSAEMRVRPGEAVQQYVESGRKIALMSTAETVFSDVTISSAAGMFRIMSSVASPTFMVIMDASRVFTGAVFAINSRRQLSFEELRRAQNDLFANQYHADNAANVHKYKAAAAGAIRITGRNGVGKTTFMNSLSEKMDQPIHMVQRSEDVSCQHWDEVVACGQPIDHLQVRTALVHVGLAGAAAAKSLNEPIGDSLSGGQIRLLMLARVVYAASLDEVSPAAAILLDEPDAGITANDGAANDGATNRLPDIINGWATARPVFVIMHNEQIAARIKWVDIVNLD